MPKAVTKRELRPAVAFIDLFAWIVLVIPIATAIAVFVVLGTIPGYIARKRGHPWAEAVTVRGRYRRGETTIDPARLRFATELMMRKVFRMRGGSMGQCDRSGMIVQNAGGPARTAADNLTMRRHHLFSRSPSKFATALLEAAIGEEPARARSSRSS